MPLHSITFFSIFSFRPDTSVNLFICARASGILFSPAAEKSVQSSACILCNF